MIKERVIMRLKNSIVFYIVCIMLVCICSGKVQAASQAGISLKSGESNSSYDVTGDGVKDTVRVELTDNVKPTDEDGRTGMIQVFVNDNIVFEQKREADPCWDVKLIKLANGKVFFDIESTVMSEDDCIHQLYIWENGKLKSVYDFQKYFNKYASYYFVDIVKVSGNTINTEVRAQFHTTGMVRFNMNIVYKDGAFKRTSNTFTPKYKAMSRKNKWTAGKKIKVYKKVGSKKTAYTLKKGNVVKLNKIIYKNNKVYFQIKNNNGKGKRGYIPAAKKYSYPQYFKESQYAG